MNRSKTQANHVAIISINLNCFELWIVNQKAGGPHHTDCRLQSFCFTFFFFLLGLPFFGEKKKKASFYSFLVFFEMHHIKQTKTRHNTKKPFKCFFSFFHKYTWHFVWSVFKRSNQSCHLRLSFSLQEKKKKNHPKIRLKTTIPSMSMANDVVQRPLLVMLMFVSQH